MVLNIKKLEHGGKTSDDEVTVPPESPFNKNMSAAHQSLSNRLVSLDFYNLKLIIWIKMTCALQELETEIGHANVVNSLLWDGIIVTLISHSLKHFTSFLCQKIRLFKSLIYQCILYPN